MVFYLDNENVGRVSFRDSETDVNRRLCRNIGIMKHYIPGAITMCKSHLGILPPGIIEMT
jgi:hypothetical protein